MKKFGLLLGVLLLTSCGNFNKIYLYPPESTSTPQRSPTAGGLLNAPIVQQEGELLCPMFVKPELNPIPPLPLAELARVPSSDNTQIDTIQQRHIEELRRHIFHERRRLNALYDRYLEECRVRQRKATAK